MNFCDVCDALLTESEESGGVRWGQSLCHHCAAEFDAANGESDE